jgi:hypothetical protein
MTFIIPGLRLDKIEISDALPMMHWGLESREWNRARQITIDNKIMSTIDFNIVTGQLCHPRNEFPINHPYFEPLFKISVEDALQIMKKHGVAKEAYETLVGPHMLNIYVKYFNVGYVPYGYSKYSGSDNIYIPLDQKNFKNRW